MQQTIPELGEQLIEMTDDRERVDLLLRYLSATGPIAGDSLDAHLHRITDVPPEHREKALIARVYTVMAIARLFRGVGYSTDNAEHAMELYRSMQDREGETHVCFHLCSALRGTGDYRGALDYGRRSLEYWRALGSPQGTAGALSQIGIIHSDMGEHADALRHLREALAICEEAGARRGIARELNAISIVLTELGIYDQALEYLQRSLALREEMGEDSEVAACLNNLGVLYQHIHDHDRALAVLERGLQMGRRIGVGRSVSRALMNLGNTYVARNEPSIALDYFRQGAALHEEMGDMAGNSNALNGIGRIHYGLGQYDEALRCCRRAAGIAEEIGNRPALIASLCTIAATLGAMEEYGESVETFEKALRLAEETGARVDLRDIHHELAAALKRRGDYRDAIEHYVEYIRLHREIYSEEMNRRLQNMTIAYEVEQMEKEAKILRLSNERLEQEAEFRKKELTSTAMHLTQKNEFLRKLRRRVEEISRDAILPEVAGSLKGVMAEIDEAVESEQHWSTFEKQFHQVHAGYLEVLAERYPKLTPTELKVCALIKINVSTKEIAQILNTEPRSIEKYRQRIRKKLELAQDENLGAFLIAMR